MVRAWSARSSGKRNVRRPVAGSSAKAKVKISVDPLPNARYGSSPRMAIGSNLAATALRHHLVSDPRVQVRPMARCRAFRKSEGTIVRVAAVGSGRGRGRVRGPLRRADRRFALTGRASPRVTLEGDRTIVVSLRAIGVTIAAISRPIGEITAATSGARRESIGGRRVGPTGALIDNGLASKRGGKMAGAVGTEIGGGMPAMIGVVGDRITATPSAFRDIMRHTDGTLATAGSA